MSEKGKARSGGSKRYEALSRGEGWAPLNLDISEERFQKLVLDLAAWCGWHHRYHTHDSRRSEQGFPDLVLIRRERLIFAELKTEKGKTSAYQRAWLEALGWTKAEVYLWRPSDWPEIKDSLK